LAAGDLGLILFVWGWKFIHPMATNLSAAVPSLRELPFHEAGHIFFGLWAMDDVSGGTLGNCCPLVCLVAFW